MTESDKKLLTASVFFKGGVDCTTLNSAGVLIDGAEIKEMGPADELRQKHPDVPTEHFANKLLMPGLVNTHAHLSMSMLRGLADDLPLDEWLKETYQFRKKHLSHEIEELGVKISLAESIKNGVTTLADMSFYQHRYLEDVRKSGVRAILYDTIMEEYEGTEREDEVLSFIQNSTDTDRIIRGAALHAPYSCSESMLDWFVNSVVRNSDSPYAIHLAETRDEIDSFRNEKDMTSTEWLRQANFLTPRLLAVHGVWLEENDINTLVQHDVGVSHNPESNMKLGAGTAPVPDFLDAGLNVGLGTDSAASNNDLNIFSEMDAAGKLQKVSNRDPEALSAEIIVSMATTMGAKVLGLDQVVGSLEPGKQADIITLDLDQLHLRPVYNIPSLLTYSALGEEVQDVWVNGKPLMRNRKLQTIDEEKLMEDMNQVNYQINRQRDN